MNAALIQHETEPGDKETNRDRCLSGLREAGEAGARLAVLPELATSGYAIGERHLDLAEPIPGPTTDAYGEVAAEYGMFVVAGIAEAGRTRGQCYNSAVLIDDAGDVVGTYRKTHLALYVHTSDALVEEKELFTPGDELPVFETDIGTVGILICQDGNYPEAFRELALKGADYVVIVYNSPTGEMLTLRSRVAAYVNGMYVLLSNKSGTETAQYVGEREAHGEREVEYTGRSHVVDPNGDIVGKLPRDETGVLFEEVDLDEVVEARWKMKFLRDYRPELYGEIGR